jgi:hypothetical protein
MEMDKLKSWLRQPTTVAGISALLGTAVAVLLGQMSGVAAVPLVAGAAVSMILPDNSAAKQQATSVAQDIVTRLTEKQGVAS